MLAFEERMTFRQHRATERDVDIDRTRPTHCDVDTANESNALASLLRRIQAPHLLLDTLLFRIQEAGDVVIVFGRSHLDVPVVFEGIFRQVILFDAFADD